MQNLTEKLAALKTWWSKRTKVQRLELVIVALVVIIIAALIF